MTEEESPLARAIRRVYMKGAIHGVVLMGVINLAYFFITGRC